MSLHGKNFIGDQLRSGAGQTFSATSPLDCSPLPGTFHHAALSDVEEAVSLAEAAFGTYGSSSGEERARFLEKIADEIMALGNELIDRARLETGLPEARLTGE